MSLWEAALQVYKAILQQNELNIKSYPNDEVHNVHDQKTHHKLISVSPKFLDYHR